MTTTFSDYVNDPDCPFAIVGDHGLIHTTGALEMARNIARKLVSGGWGDCKRQRKAIIHRHNGKTGWQAGTEIVETF